MDLLSALGLETSIDAATFTVAAAIFVAVELTKLAIPSSLLGSPKGERLVRILPLLLGAVIGIFVLRVVSTSVVVPSDALLSGLRRGLAAGAIAMGGWEIWRVTGRAAWRALLLRIKGEFGGSAGAGKPDPIIHLDPHKRRPRVAKPRAPHPPKADGE